MTQADKLPPSLRPSKAAFPRTGRVPVGTLVRQTQGGCPTVNLDYRVGIPTDDLPETDRNGAVWVPLNLATAEETSVGRVNQVRYAARCTRRGPWSGRLHVAEPWLSADDIAAHLGVTKDTVYVWTSEKRVPAHNLGRLWKVQASEVDSWVKSGGASSGSHHAGSKAE
jgi:excisionase family DNA binding protein